MTSNPDPEKKPEQDKEEALSRYTDRRSMFDDLVGMDEVPSVPEKTEARSVKNESDMPKDESLTATVVHDYKQIQESLKSMGLTIGDEPEIGETEAMLPIKDVNGFHIAVMVPGQRIQPILWPDGAETITIGRDKLEADVAINDNRVSRVHLQIKRIDDENIEVTDLGSTNHTYMSQDPLKAYEPVKWKFGDIIVVGRTRLVLRRGIPHT